MQIVGWEDKKQLRQQKILKLKINILIMETNKQAGLSQKKYLQPGTYLWKFKQQFLYSGVANLLTTTLLAPLQRWRIIRQTQKFYPLRTNKIKNILDYFSRIPKEQGFFALWRGNNAAVWIYLYQTIFQIGMFDTIKHINKQVNHQTSQVPELSYVFDNVLFPLFASILTLGVIHPLDTFRIHRSMSFHPKQSEALFTKFRHRRAQLGLRSMYNGFILANLISVINFNLYKNVFTLFDQSYASLTNTSSKPDENQPNIDILGKQLIFSVLAVALVHPLDTLKKIYQLNNMSRPVMFQGYRGVFRYMNQNKLSGALWNGMGASVARTLLFAPIYWGVLNIWRSHRQTRRIQ